MNNTVQTGVHHDLAGYYRVSIVDGLSGQVVWEQPELQKNLILNQGLDQVNTLTYANLMTYAISGTGTRNNYVDPAGSTLSQTGFVITLVPTGSGSGLNHLTSSFSGFGTALEVGDVIQYLAGGDGTNTTATVLAVTDLSASVDTDIEVSPSQSFYIWKTSQTLLQNEQQRSNTYLSSFNGNVFTNVGVASFYRTIDFLTESVMKTYGEVAVGWSGTANSATIFSRVTLPSPVVVNAGQKLRVYFQLNVNAGPSSSSYRPNVSIGGWPVSPSTNTNGTESIQNVVFSIIQSSGTSIPTTNFCLEPSVQGSDCNFFISTISSSLLSWGSAVDRSNGNNTAYYTTQASTKNNYTVGSYTVDKQATISAAAFNSQNIRAMGLCNGTPGSSTTGLTFLFDQNQTKFNTQTLTLGWRWTWGRTLSN